MLWIIKRIYCSFLDALISDNNYAGNTTNKLYLVLFLNPYIFMMDTSNIIKKVYVITRNADNMPFKNGFFSHSALLLVDDAGQMFKLDSGDGRLSVFSLFLDPVDQPIQKHMTINGKLFEPVITYKIIGDKTVGHAAAKMYELTSRRPYNLINWNCHIVQEKVCEYLGVRVANKYSFMKVINQTPFV